MLDRIAVEIRKPQSVIGRIVGDAERSGHSAEQVRGVRPSAAEGINIARIVIDSVIRRRIGGSVIQICSGTERIWICVAGECTGERVLRTELSSVSSERADRVRN